MSRSGRRAKTLQDRGRLTDRASVDTELYRAEVELGYEKMARSILWQMRAKLSFSPDGSDVSLHRGDVTHLRTIIDPKSRWWEIWTSLRIIAEAEGLSQRTIYGTK